MASSGHRRYHRLVVVQDRQRHASPRRPGRPGPASGRSCASPTASSFSAAFGSAANSGPLLVEQLRQHRRLLRRVGARPVTMRNAHAACSAGVVPPSFSIRWPRNRAASTICGSLSSASACSGVLVALPPGGADAAVGGVERGHRRRRGGPLPERVQARGGTGPAPSTAGTSAGPSPRSTARPAGTGRRSARPASRPAGRRRTAPGRAASRPSAGGPGTGRAGGCPGPSPAAPASTADDWR